MNSAACYTNKRRLLADAKNTKVQYPGTISVNTDPLYSTINCNPNFEDLLYIELCKCKPPRPAILVIGILSGGNSSTESTNTFSGGVSTTNAPITYSGGVA